MTWQAGTCTCTSANTTCAGQCVDLQTNTQHCGSFFNWCKPGESCGNHCNNDQNFQNGVCGRFAPNQLCNGQCVNLTTDHNNSGTCGCSSGLTWCSSTCANTNENNCGGCGLQCNTSQVCTGGLCISADP